MLTPARLIRRYKRFLADVVCDDGTLLTVHCPNSGAMLGVQQPGSRIWLSQSDNPKRTYVHTWEIVESDSTLVGINTQIPNKLVNESLLMKDLPEFKDYDTIRREVDYGQQSRIDFLLETPRLPPCYVEVKNVHLKRDGHNAEFPDCVTARGAKHMRELAYVVQQGARAVIFYVVQRRDCHIFKIARDIDFDYWQAYQYALLHGVEQICYQCDITLTGIKLDKRLPIAAIDDGY